ncbi:30S ribosomal protein S6 [Helicobacter sp. 11S02596-1]|uniref:30S ribosomal protein S6 n=1 Tax=Helicobacter sp. 11S02596-1 TaxID=1476194 RepID=UPI000BA6DD56|nr:30S ribosomal protein S6 [Helicobacter sp. 11S02596-1]PAF43135.1 30S ribosomal protein S6 [Helicobacter sp. 11S02596-1]
MKHYETMFVLKPTLVEEEIKSKIDFYKEAITKNGGVIETCLDMGMRNLAYEVKKHHRGYYFVIYFKAEPSFILELERLYRINEDILRFIVIKYESKKEQKAWQTLVDKANKKPESKSVEQKAPTEDTKPEQADVSQAPSEAE